MNSRYIFISSAYRNRNQYPLVSTFEIPLSQTGPKTTPFDALDPIIDSFPSYNFEGNSYFVRRGWTSFYPIPYTPTINPPLDFYRLPYVPTFSVIGIFGGGTALNPILTGAPSTQNNDYVNRFVYSVALSEYRLITAYNGTTKVTTVNPPFTVAPSGTYRIYDALVASNGIFSGGTAANPVLQLTEPSIGNYFINHKILDLATGELRTITSYNGVTKAITLDSAFGGGWSVADKYRIFEAIDTFNGGTNVAPQLSVDAVSPAGYPDGWYNGYQITDTTLHESRIITSYKASTGEITLSSSFSSAWLPTDTYTIQDASLGSNGKNIFGSFLPGSNYVDPIITSGYPDGYFNGMFLVDLACNSTATITDYDGSTGRVTLSIPFFYTFCAVPSTPFAVDANTSIGYTINLQPIAILTGVGEPSNKNAYYSGYYLIDETLEEYRFITKYNATTRTVTIDTPFSNNWDVDDYYTLRKEVPFIQDQYTVFPPNPGPNFNQVQLNPSGPVSQNLTGKYLINRIDNNAYRTYYLIQNHNTTTNVATISPSPSSSFNITPLPFGNPYYDILDFSRDNLYPLVYTGSNVPQNQMVCYEITLINLSLPNTPISGGSLIAFYPYVIVEFYNITDSNAGTTNIIYSNNPNTRKAIFIVGITDISDPFSSQFIKLDANSMTQTIKFKPNDNFFFSVKLPDGTPFEPVIPDNFSPLEPKPELQVSAVFSIKRL